MDCNTALKKFNEHYDYAADNITQVFGGTVGYTYIIGSYFLKVYDKSLSVTPRCTEYLKERLDALDLFQRSTALKDRICYPLPTKSGGLFQDEGGYIYVLFNLIPGGSIGWDRPFSDDELEQTADIMACLHNIDPALCPGIPRENFRLDFCDELIALLNGGISHAGERFVHVMEQYQDEISEKTVQAKGLAAEISGLCPQFVLCHTDVHGGNIMKDPFGRLYLIDWENLILAPREADLFAFCEAPYFRLFKERTNPKSLLFYLIRRDLEDIWEFLRTVLYDGAGKEEQDEIYGHVVRICGHLKGLR